MSNELELEVFRIGDYDEKGNYTEDDLDQIAADYDPAFHEAPVTFDHDQSGPAYGWVKSLRRVGDVLLAKLKDLSAQFLTLLKDGAYKKRSIELYREFRQTGRPYLRAVSFLGAMAPEVKGLADPVFSDESDYDEIDFFKEENQEEKVSDLEREPSVEETDTGETGNLGTFEEMEQHVERLMTEKEEIASTLEKERTEKKRTEIQRFVDEMKQEGKVLPSWEELGLVRFMESLEHDRNVVFGEDDRRTLFEWFRDFLISLPPVVRFDEVASETSPKSPERFPLPGPAPHAMLSSASVDLHRRIVRFLEANPGITYGEAMREVVKVP